MKRCRRDKWAEGKEFNECYVSVLLPAKTLFQTHINGFSYHNITDKKSKH